MPESPETLRAAKAHLDTLPIEEAVETLTSWGLSPDEEFFLLYADDPVRYVLDIFDWDPDDPLDGPAPYQIDTLSHLVDDGRVAAYGPRGLGKTALDSWVVNWFADTRDGIVDWKAVTTAGGHRQLTKFLWPEIHKWARRKKWHLLGRQPYSRQYELLSNSLKLRTGEAFAAASDDPSLIEGAHATSLLYIYDESKAIPAVAFDASEGAFSNAGPETTNEGYILSTSSPGDMSGRFFEISTRKPGYEDWYVRQVTYEECVAAKRISVSWAEQRARQWGRSSSLFLNQVMGKFAKESASSVIPASWIEAAMERWHEKFVIEDPDMPPKWIVMKTERPELTAVGIDVARGGLDQTVIVPRYGNWVRQLRVEPYDENGKRLAETAMAYRSVMGGPLSTATFVVDAIGVGVSVYDHLSDIATDVEPFIGSQKVYMRDSTDTFSFSNKRSAAYWHLRELLNPETGEDVALPPDEELLGELSAPTYREMANGKVQVETKESLMQPKRLGKSPNKADGVVYSFWDEGEEERPVARAVSIRR